MTEGMVDFVVEDVHRERKDPSLRSG